MFFENAEVLNNYDLIVVGNGLDAVIAAGSAAKSGKTVALVTESELLLSEISESLLGFVNQKSPLYELLLELGASPIKVGDEYHIPSGMGSKIALKYLCENNVNLFLKASPVALLTNANLVCGIVIATSTGDTAFSLNANGAIDFSNNFQLVCTLSAPIRNAAYERFITNPIICSKIDFNSGNIFSDILSATKSLALAFP